MVLGEDTNHMNAPGSPIENRNVSASQLNTVIKFMNAISFVSIWLWLGYKTLFKQPQYEEWMKHFHDVQW